MNKIIFNILARLFNCAAIYFTTSLILSGTMVFLFELKPNENIALLYSVLSACTGIVGLIFTIITGHGRKLGNEDK